MKVDEAEPTMETFFLFFFLAKATQIGILHLTDESSAVPNPAC